MEIMRESVKFQRLFIKILLSTIETYSTENGLLTFAAMMFDDCTPILYNAVPTVRVRTEPALRDVMATVQHKLTELFDLPAVKASAYQV